MADPIIRMELFETLAIIPLASYGVGVFERKLFPQGNSLLSTLFVQSISSGAVVNVEYYEATTGEDVGENTLLEAHITPLSGLADKIIVNKIHNKPRIRVTVTGGIAVFGVYATVVSSFASDVDSSLFKDNSPANLSIDLGSQGVIYDPILNRHFFVRGSNGVQDVNVVNVTTVLGETKIEGIKTAATPGIFQDLVSITVPALKKWFLYSAKIACNLDGIFEIYIDGNLTGSGYTNAAAPNVDYKFNLPHKVLAGSLVVLKYKIRATAPIGIDVAGWLHYNEQGA